MKPVDRSAWNKFLDEVGAARTELGNPSALWYRGHARDGWSLVPSLIRQKEGLAKEQFLFREYKRSANRFHEKRDNDWETLVDMQHYGMPTRLLDWSESLGVAIAFAILRQYSTRQAADVFILDPVALNRMSGLDEVKVPANQDFDYQSVYWHKRPFAAKHPIALEAPFQNPRIFAQRGVFTIHGADLAGLEGQYPAVVRRIVLPEAANTAAREFLHAANLNEYTIYPDIFGMANHIVSQAFPASTLL